MKGFAALLLLLLLSPLFASAELLGDPSLSGHLKSANLYLDRLPSGNEEGLISSGRFRLDLSARLLEFFDLQVAVEQQLLWTDPSAFIGLPQGSVNRIFDWEKSWNPEGRVASQLQLDRFNLQGELGGGHWSFGRQAIGFGNISLFSPLDVIAPFAPDAIDVDVRPGVDALLFGRYFGMGGHFSAITVFGDRPEHNSYLLTLSENLGQLDLLLLTGSLRDRPMVGLGLAGEIGTLGVKGEISWYRGTQVGQPGGDRTGDFALAALEGWYRFASGLVLIAEYLYNGIGSNGPASYPQVAQSAPISEGLSFLLGRHYLLVGPSFELHPLVTGSGLLIHNLQDTSSLLRPQLTVSLADNLQLDLYWSFALGDKSQFDPLTGRLKVNSEFGSVGDSAGLLLRWYF